MTAKWLLALPCWGDTYVDRFIKSTLPGIEVSLLFAGSPDVEFVVQTDQSERLAEALGGYPTTFYPAPRKGDKYQQFGDAHRQAAEVAKPGQWVMFLTADVMLSREVFLACERRFTEGKKAIACCSTRTYSNHAPSAGMTAPKLLDWTMVHKHETIEAAFWGGNGRPPSTMYFQNGDDITLRCFHMHPLAVVKDRDLAFTGTLDQDLLDRFSTSEIHVVTDRYELALAEMSPKHIRWHPAAKPLDAEDIADWARRATTPMNRWLSQHRIVIQGEGRTGDRPIWNKVLHLIENPPPSPLVKQKPRMKATPKVVV